MTRAKLPLLALLVLSAPAATAQTAKPPVPVPVHNDLLKAVRVHAAVLRSQPIHLNSQSLHPFRSSLTFPDALPPVAMTSQSREPSYVGVIAK